MAKRWAGRHSERLLQLTLETYGDRCHLCGKPGSNSADHLLPRSKGGTDTIANLRPAHRQCNSRRGNRSVHWFQSRYAPHLLQPADYGNSWQFLKKP